MYQLAQSQSADAGWLDSLVPPAADGAGNTSGDVGGMSGSPEAGQVPPPPPPFGEFQLPETLTCGHFARDLRFNCEHCDSCHSVLSLLRENRANQRKPGFMPPRRPASGERKPPDGQRRGPPVSSRVNGPGGSRYATNRSGDDTCWREKDMMAKGLGPGKCDTPNCPWRHVGDPPEAKGSAPASGAESPAGMCGDVLDDPNTWPDCKYFVDPTTFGLCPGGCGLPHDERIAAYIKRMSPRLRARTQADEQFRKRSNDNNHGRPPRGQDRRPSSTGSRRNSDRPRAVSYTHLTLPTKA